MKEIALLGTTNHVFADVLGALMAKGLSVNAFNKVWTQRVRNENDSQIDKQ